MSTLIRIAGADGRGPSASLWSNLVDWVKGTLATQVGAAYFTDHVPYNAGDITAAAGTTVSAQAVRFGVVRHTIATTADGVSGFQLNNYVDLNATGFKECCFEADVNAINDNATIQAFVGFTDEALLGFFGNDNTPDGSAIGLLWNGDETVDLIAISAADAITVLKHELATGVERTAGPHSFGIRIRKETPTSYSVFGSVNGVVTRVGVASTVIPGEPMLPTVALTDDNTAAVTFDNDWVAFLERA